MAYAPADTSVTFPTPCRCTAGTPAGLGVLPSTSFGVGAQIPAWLSDWRVWAAAIGGLLLVTWMLRDSKGTRQRKRRSATARARARYQGDLAKIEARYGR